MQDAKETKPVFTPAEELLLDEFRDGYEREDKLNATYQGKTTLFLAFCGFFSALVGTTLTKLVDAWCGGTLQWNALVTLGVVFVGLLATIYLLLQASLSKEYQALANPGSWLDHLREVQKIVGEERAKQVLQQHLLDAWSEATDACMKANEGKQRLLERARRLLVGVLLMSFVGVLCYIAQGVAGECKTTMPRSSEESGGGGSNHPTPPSPPSAEPSVPPQTEQPPSAQPGAAVPQRPANRRLTEGRRGPGETGSNG